MKAIHDVFTLGWYPQGIQTVAFEPDACCCPIFIWSAPQQGGLRSERGTNGALTSFRGPLTLSDVDSVRLYVKLPGWMLYMTHYTSKYSLFSLPILLSVWREDTVLVTAQQRCINIQQNTTPLRICGFVAKFWINGEMVFFCDAV